LEPRKGLLIFTKKIKVMEHFLAMVGTVVAVAILLVIYGIDWKNKK
jgi:hypothetical protein